MRFEFKIIVAYNVAHQSELKMQKILISLHIVSLLFPHPLSILKAAEKCRMKRIYIVCYTHSRVLDHG